MEQQAKLAQTFKATLESAFRHDPQVSLISSLIQQIRSTIDAQQTQQALDMLEEVFDRYTAYFSENYDDDERIYEEEDFDEHSDAVQSLTKLLRQALLDSELDEEQREKWQGQIEYWQSQYELLFDPIAAVIDLLNEP